MKKKHRLLIGIIVLLASATQKGSADPVIPAGDQDRKGNQGISSKDLEKRNQRAEEVLILHNKNVVVVSTSPGPAPQPGSPPVVPPNPVSSPAVTQNPMPSGLPDPIPVPGTAPSDRSKETRAPENQGSGSVTQPAAAAFANLSILPANVNSSSAKSKIQENLKTDGVKPQEAAAADQPNKALLTTSDKPPVVSDAAVINRSDSDQATPPVAPKDMPDLNSLAVKTKHLDASQLAGLKDRRVEGSVIYNNYTSDISSLMAGEVGIISDSTYYFVRFSNEESKKIAKGAQIKAYLTEPHALEGEILWRGKLE